MDFKNDKQFWLENVLKKLYKKVHTLRKHRNYGKKKLNVSTTNISAFRNRKRERNQNRESQKREERTKYQIAFQNPKREKNRNRDKNQKRDKSMKYQIVTRSREQKSLQKKKSEKPAKRKYSKYSEEKFWKFVDKFLQSKSFLSKRKNSFLVPVVPSNVNNTYFRSVGNTLTLRSRVISRQTSNESLLLGDYLDEGYLRSEINSTVDRKALAQKIFFITQRARMKRAADVIAKEVLGERKAKKT